MAAGRAERMRLYEGIASNRPYEPGVCVWCGERIVLVDPGDYRRANRTRHRGDEHEVGNRNCDELDRFASWWSARKLIGHRGDPDCVDCGSTGPWEADHDQPLERGGAHCPTNIVRRCVPCHRRKSAREASVRAQRRREVSGQIRLLEGQPSSPLRAVVKDDAHAGVSRAEPFEVAENR